MVHESSGISHRNRWGIKERGGEGVGGAQRGGVANDAWRLNRETAAMLAQLRSRLAW